jgi:integrase
VKIAGRWVFATAPIGTSGRPEVGYVIYRGERVKVDGGTFYLDSGSKRTRKSVACGTDPEGVYRAMKTQGHVLALRRSGMDVDDAPEIVDNRRRSESSLGDVYQEFKDAPPGGFTVKTVKKYRNALLTFKTWSAERGVTYVSDVTPKLITRWISHLQHVEGLDASTVVPKVRIVMAELKAYGVTIKLADRDLPTIVEREREIYIVEQLDQLLAACDLDEYELVQTFLLTGMRRREVAFLSYPDIDPVSCTAKVTAKRQMGFIPKAYHERIIPIPRSLVDLLQARGIRHATDGAGLIYGTSRKWRGRGGKADGKLLEKLKQIARRSGLNCGHCIGTYEGQPVTCATHACCRRWGLHKFRHTYATSMLRDNVDIVTLSKWLGHKDLATTRIYLRALEAEWAQPQVERSMLAVRFGQMPVPAERETKPRAPRPPKRDSHPRAAAADLP